MDSRELANLKMNCLHLAMDAAKVSASKIEPSEVIKDAEEFEKFVLSK